MDAAEPKETLSRYMDRQRRFDAAAARHQNGDAEVIPFSGPLRKLKPGEPDPADFAPGWFKEVGYSPVSVVKDDPIFDGLGSAPVFFESHYWQISQMPPEFETLASTANCAVQVFRHKQQLIYGTQFHPEVNSAEHRDGRKLIGNFFRIAGLV